MKFWEAMKALEEGKRVRCKSWEPRAYWLVNGTVGTYATMIYIHDMRYEEWELYNESFSFSQVIQGLKDGKKFKREGWEAILKTDDEGYLIDTRDNELIALQIEDFEATDWIEVK